MGNSKPFLHLIVTTWRNDDHFIGWLAPTISIDRAGLGTLANSRGFAFSSALIAFNCSSWNTWKSAKGWWLGMDVAACIFFQVGSYGKQFGNSKSSRFISGIAMFFFGGRVGCKPSRFSNLSRQDVTIIGPLQLMRFLEIRGLLLAQGRRHADNIDMCGVQNVCAKSGSITVNASYSNSTYKQSHICSGKNLETQPLILSGSFLWRSWSKNKNIKNHKNTSTNLLVENPTKSKMTKKLPPFLSDFQHFFQLPKPFHTSSIHLGISMVHSPCSSICRASASFQGWLGFLGFIVWKGLLLKGIYP